MIKKYNAWSLIMWPSGNLRSEAEVSELIVSEIFGWVMLTLRKVTRRRKYWVRTFRDGKPRRFIVYFALAQVAKFFFKAKGLNYMSAAYVVTRNGPSFGRLILVPRLQTVESVKRSVSTHWAVETNCFCLSFLHLVR